MNARAAVERRLVKLGRDDRVALFTTSGEVKVEFTTDRDRLQAGLEKLNSHRSANNLDCPPMSYYEADLLLNQADFSLLDEKMQSAISCKFSGGGISANLGGAGEGSPSKGTASAAQQVQAGTLQAVRQLVLARAAEVAIPGRMENDRQLKCCMKPSAARWGCLDTETWSCCRRVF